MAITPDTKDWTWVLERPCPECGFDTQGFAVEAVPGMIMANTAAWQAALDGARHPRARPEPAQWCPPRLGEGRRPGPGGPRGRGQGTPGPAGPRQSGPR